MGSDSKRAARTPGNGKVLDAYILSRDILRRIQRASTLGVGAMGSAPTSGRSLH